MDEPEIHVAQIHFEDDPERLKAEILERLRALPRQPMPTKYWRYEAGTTGRVLAEQRGGAVTIYQDVCRDVLGEDV